MSMESWGDGASNNLAYPPKTKWKKYFALKPVYIDGQKYWFTTVYRRYEIIRGEFYNVQYGTLLDLIKSNEQ